MYSFDCEQNLVKLIIIYKGWGGGITHGSNHGIDICVGRFVETYNVSSTYDRSY